MYTLNDILIKVFMLPGIVIGLSFHEFAHAFVSDKLGDPTPRRQGRLTLNPMAHIDWIGFIALIIMGFGWGRAVQIDPSYYKNRRLGEFLVGIAGVTMNLLLAVVFAIPIRLMQGMHNTGGAASMLTDNIFWILMYAVMINLALMIFNLIPCPPLDGFGILTQIFKLDRYDYWHQINSRGNWILLIIVVTGISKIIISPLVNILMNILIY